MGKTLIIAEKPSLAKNIMNAIGINSFSCRDGYYENEEYIVSWAFGHLLALIDIEDYENCPPRKSKYSWTMKGLARTYIDWLYGVNLTRLATLKSKSFLRVGRVIVPIVT